MKTIESYSALTRNARAAALKSEVAGFSKGQKIIAKILFASEKAGDFEPGEKTNAFAQRVTGIELRRECQGVYEALRVLSAMADKSIAMTETEFDNVRGFSLVIISGLLGKKDPAKLARAVAISLSGDKDTVAQLKALTAKVKKTPGAKNPDSTPPLEGNEIFPDLSDLNVTTYQVPDSLVILNHPEILKRIIAEVQAAETAEDCDAFAGMFAKLAAMAEKRKQSLGYARAESAKPARASKRKAASPPLELVA